MKNKFKIPEKKLKKLFSRDKKCVYCHKKMIFPYNRNNHKDSVTIEHLNSKGPFYWEKGLEMQDVVICCGECNSSRGKKFLKEWFESSYCKKKDINQKTVSKQVREYLIRKKQKVFQCL